MLNNKSQKGFTLVEMLVAVAIFMVVVTVAMTALMSVINANRKARAIQSVVSNVNFVIESISRDIRMGGDYYCGFSQSYDVNCAISGNNVVNYMPAGNSIGAGSRVYYKFTPPNLDTGSKGYLSKCNTTCGSSNSANYSQITSPDVNVLSMEFYVVRGSGVQPKVVIIMEGEAGGLNDTRSKFSLQTTASQRQKGI